MGDKVTINVEPREVHGKKVEQLRKNGIIPGTVYGAGIDPVSVQMNGRELIKAVKEAGRHTPVHLTGSKKRIAMIKDIDIHPVRHEIRHVSFHAVRADEPVVTGVPIRLVGEGESVAEKNGLVILQALEEIEIRALPMELPEALEISIVNLTDAGDRVIVGEIKLPEGVEIVERKDNRQDDEGEERPSIMDLVIASVYEPAALEAANEAVAGEAESAEAGEVEAKQGGEAEPSSDGKTESTK